MKKIISVLMVLIMLVSLAACGKVNNGGNTTETFVGVSSKGGSVDINADSAKLLLGSYTPSQLGLVDPIEYYELVLSAEEYNGATACKVEAFAEDAKAPEGVFLIDGNACYVYDSKKQDYVLLGDNKTSVTKSSASGTTAIPVDPEISMQYHHGNNEKMRERFSKYDVADMGLSRAVEELVFIVTDFSVKSIDGETVYGVEVYEKNGTKLPAKLAFSENGEYIYNTEEGGYVKLVEKETTTAQ